eukprot:TRINITY_DN32263_c0_g1_i1.p1 TRINITY_DN32263_c0_g1~~TRINITY_DN32263_c0_g1_i1.p1  ORF type:complete len:560 (-),score=71.64 TRINITY_DN32263_c0_g1_i1:22-1620(-)
MGRDNAVFTVVGRPRRACLPEGDDLAAEQGMQDESTDGSSQAMPGDASESAEVVQITTVEEAVGTVGIGGFQWRLLLLCGFACCADGMEKTALMYLVDAASSEWDVHGEELGLLGSVSGLGQAIGATAFGQLSDIKGRRWGLLWALVTTFITGVICAMAPNYWLFLLLRLLANIGLGGALPCAFTLLSEYLPTEERSRWLPYLYTSYGCGRFATALIARLALNMSWRFYVLLIALPSGGLILCKNWLPETPQFLLATGRQDEAYQALEDLAEQNNCKIKWDLSQLAELPDAASVPESRRCLVFRFRSGICLCMMWFLLALSTEWVNWALKELDHATIPSGMVYTGLIFVNLNELIAPLLVAAFPRSLVFRRTRLVVGLACIVAASAIVGFAWVLRQDRHPLLMITLCASASILTMVVWVLHYTITPAYFPDELRGTGFGTCMTCNRLGFMVSPLLAATVVESRPFILIGCCGMLFLTIAAMVMFLGPPPTAEDVAAADERSMLADAEERGATSEAETSSDVASPESAKAACV